MFLIVIVIKYFRVFCSWKRINFGAVSLTWFTSYRYSVSYFPMMAYPTGFYSLLVLHINALMRHFKSMLTPHSLKFVDTWTSHSFVNIFQIYSPFHVNHHYFSGKDFNRFWNVAAGIYPLNYKSISDVAHWCQLRKSGAFSIPKVFIVVVLRDLCRPFEFFHTNLGKPSFMELSLCILALSFWNRFGALSFSERKL